MRPIFMFPYKMPSKGGRALRDALKAEGVQVKYNNQLTHITTKWLQEHPNFILLNWGSANIPSTLRQLSETQLNKQSGVTRCGNKWKFFSDLKDKVRTPEVTKDLEVAMKWIEDGKEVLGRQCHGSCGLDIAFFDEDPERFQGSEFWSLYKKKKDEFRVHLFKDKVIAVQRKALRTTDPETNEPIDKTKVDFRIRNLRNGFVFQRHDLSVPADVIDQAKLAVSAAGVDFGAVDVIYNGHEAKAYVLEINTAPGLEGETINDYMKAVKEFAAQ